MESEVTVFPHPDSPTMPSVSPGWTSKETPSTARAVPPPCSVTKYVLRSRTRSRGSVTPPPRPLPARVEGVAQPVGDPVERHHHQRDGEAREQGGPGRRGDLLGAVEDHAAPARGGRRDPEAEEREPCLEQHHVADPEGRRDDDRRGGVGQDVAETTRPVPAPSARAAATKSRSRSESTSPRTSQLVPN